MVIFYHHIKTTKANHPLKIQFRSTQLLPVVSFKRDKKIGEFLTVHSHAIMHWCIGIDWVWGCMKYVESVRT